MQGLVQMPDALKYNVNGFKVMDFHCYKHFDGARNNLLLQILFDQYKLSVSSASLVQKT